MAKIIYHLDDNSTARAIFAKLLLFQKILPDCDLRHYFSVATLIKDLEAKTEERPWMIFTDLNLPGETGIDLMSHIRRNPKQHYIPIVPVSSEADQKSKEEANQFGAFGFIEKPVTVEALGQMITKRLEYSLQEEDFVQLAADFAEKAGKRVLEVRRLILPLDAKKIKMMTFLLHTLKGEAQSLLFCTLAHFAHRAETLMSAIDQYQAYSFGRSEQLVIAILDFFIAQLRKIKSKELLDLPSGQLLTDFDEVQIGIRTAFEISQTHTRLVVPVKSGEALPTVEMSRAPHAYPPYPAKKSASLIALGVELDPLVLERNTGHPISAALGSGGFEHDLETEDNIEISLNRLDDLQGSIKKILMKTVQMNSQVIDLKKEFPDQAFPLQLEESIQGLSDEALELINNLFAILTVPASHLEPFFKQTVASVSRILGKPMVGKVQIDSALELDKAMAETLKYAIIHLVRNSVDHGIESADERKANGKAASGEIQLKIQTVRRQQVLATVEDDGRGLDLDQIRRKAIELKLKNFAELELMSNQDIGMLIFLDGFSTKGQVTQISGRGVGLSAIIKMVSAKKGTVSVEFTQGKGTVFKIQLPRLLKLIGS